MKNKHPETQPVVKDGIILGLGTFSILGLFFLGRWGHAQVHGACNCIHGLLLEYGPATLMMLLGLGVLLSVLMTRTNQRLRLQSELQKANARMTKDLGAAAELQRSLLPHRHPDTPNVNFSWAYKPSQELAGDIFNLLPLDDDLVALYMLDVSGHGVPAALLSVTLHRVLLPISGRSSLVVADTGEGGCRPVPPADVALQLNRQFPMQPEKGQYFTLLYGLLNSRTLEFRFTCAGHPPPAYLARDKAPRILNVSGFPVGLLRQATYEDHSLFLRPGDRLYFYSDGVTEAMNPEEESFGAERLLETLRRGFDNSIEESLSLLMETLRQWCAGAPHGDDISLLAVEIW
jgi:phosphoserine phosphatase RsbU/P